MKHLIEKLKTITPASVGTIVRTLCLVLALANQLLTALGKSPLPFTDEEVAQVVSFAITAATALAAWWKNNSFTKAAVMADGVMHEIKCTGAECACVTIDGNRPG